MNEPTAENRIPIGVVWMETDSSIVVRIRAEGPGMVGEANMLFTTGHPKYQQVLNFVGGLAPEEAKSVFEWDFDLS